VHIDVPNTGFSEGQSVCNIFVGGDCVVIKGGKLPVYLNNGEAKIFVPKTSSFFFGVYPEAEAPVQEEVETPAEENVETPAEENVEIPAEENVEIPAEENVEIPI
jgi:hypothetical protein